MQFIAASDLHGIEQNKTAVGVFRNFVEDRPKTAFRIFTGDLWNFAALRRQAEEYEKTIRLKEDFLAGIEFLEWYKPAILILGNHDQRLWDAVSRERVRASGWKAELAESYVKEFEKFAKQMKIRVLNYSTRKGVYRVNGLAFAHGYGSGDQMGKNMGDTFGDVIYGHGHRIDRTPTLKGLKPVTAYQIGCLCRDDMDYARADLGALKQEHGFAYGTIEPKVEVFQARIVNGQAIVADGFKVYHAKGKAASASD